MVDVYKFPYDSLVPYGPDRCLSSQKPYLSLEPLVTVLCRGTFVLPHDWSSFTNLGSHPWQFLTVGTRKDDSARRISRYVMQSITAATESDASQDTPSFLPVMVNSFDVFDDEADELDDLQCLGDDSLFLCYRRNFVHVSLFNHQKPVRHTHGILHGMDWRTRFDPLTGRLFLMSEDYLKVVDYVSFPVVDT